MNKIDFTISAKVSVRWWVRPSIKFAGWLVTMCARHGLKVGKWKESQ